MVTAAEPVTRSAQRETPITGDEIVPRDVVPLSEPESPVPETRLPATIPAIQPPLQPAAIEEPPSEPSTSPRYLMQPIPVPAPVTPDRIETDPNSALSGKSAPCRLTCPQI